MGGARAFARDDLPRLLPRLRGIVVGEPTLLRPIVAHNGVIRWRTTTRGVAAHSADPSRGRSAIAAMVKVIGALESGFIPLATRSHPLTGRAAASINVIRGGTAVNIIPPSCEIHCDRRTAPGEDAAQVLRDRDRPWPAWRSSTTSSTSSRPSARSAAARSTPGCPRSFPGTGSTRPPAEPRMSPTRATTPRRGRRRSSSAPVTSPRRTPGTSGCRSTSLPGRLPSTAI